MLIRQRILLDILHQAGEPLSRLRLVKFAFFLRQRYSGSIEGAFYDFVPYKYGPFSFALYREAASLASQGCLTWRSGEPVALSGDGVGVAKRLHEQISVALRRGILNVIGELGPLSDDQLLRRSYAEFPWYASRTEKPELLPEVPVPVSCKPAVYTVGYEGRSIDGFCNRLLEAGVRCVVDIRSCPVSRKYGFSKRRLCETLHSLGLAYQHMPGLGVPSSQRKNLRSPADYLALFTFYESVVLPQQHTLVLELANTLRGQPTVLMCMEKVPSSCHRSRLAKVLGKVTELPVVHL